MDYDDPQARIVRLTAGENLKVNTDGFQNDVENFSCADDVLTLLIHLGYLTYHDREGTVQIPNEEVRLEFKQLLTRNGPDVRWMELIRRSQKLLEDTIAGNEEAVAAAFEEIRGESYAPQFYNNEQALRAVIKYAYIVTFGQYVKIEEMSSGKGLAHAVFIPGAENRLPAMVVELKWNRSSDEAIFQIIEKRYMDALRPYFGNLLLVGISYDEKTGKHTCRIEKR